MEKIKWTIEEYKERVLQMQQMGLSEEQISWVLQSVTITSDRPMFFISEE